MCQSIVLHAAAGVLAAALCFAPSPIAHAQSSSSSKQQFASAQHLFEAKKFGEALPQFRAVFAESGSPNARLYVARCLREVGDLPGAYEEMSATLRDARAKAETDPKYAQTRDAAAAELAILDGKIGKVMIALADDAGGAEVTLNDQPIAAARLRAPIAVTPGTVVVRAKLAGHEPAERRASVKSGDTTTITLSFGGGDSAKPAAAPIAPAAAPAAPTALSTQPTPETTSGGGVRTAGFGVAGIGVAGFVVFAITGAMGSSKYSSVKTSCGGVRCTDPLTESDIDSGKRFDLIANVGLVVGIAGVAAGVTMIAFGGPKKSPSTSVGFVPAAGGGGLRVSGAF